MMISIIGTVAEMERSRIRENQREGIELAKLRGDYKGRRKGAKSDI
jgi:DNA invertase Pin-like site-specific DNA recombinase